MLNLLEAPIFTTDTEGQVSLPGVLNLLSCKDVIMFPNLRPHQKMAWHAFLVQLAAIALSHNESLILPSTEEGWKVLLKTLTKQWPNDEPWTLVQPDLSNPGFFQPPISGQWKPTSEPTPDKIDFLITSKNHDLKAERMWNSEPEDWAYALISAQTQQGYLGKYHYGISRMNGGFSSRLFVGIMPQGGNGVRFRRDVHSALAQRNEICEKFLLKPKNGFSLIWHLPWDGSNSILFEELDPFYIETCLPVRLHFENERIIALKGPSKVPRINSKDLKGRTGDLWAPLFKEKEITSISIPKEGFDYERVSNILFEYDPSPLQKITSLDPDAGLNMHFFCITRGQGVTEGLHERIIPFNKGIKRLFTQNKDKLSSCAKERIFLAKNMSQKVLKPALEKLFTEHNSKKKYVRFLQSFNEFVDQSFFEDLWTEVETEHASTIRNQWICSLKNQAFFLLKDATRLLSPESLSSYKAKSQAERSFFIQYNKNFSPLLKDPHDQPNT